MTSIVSVANNAIADAHSNLKASDINKPASTSSETEKKSSDKTDSQASNVNLSTRAQKIQKINEEFFSGGPSSVVITSEFVERLYEYGFISADEAESLGAKSLSNGPKGTLGELSSFIDQFNETLAEKNPQDSFIDILNNAQSIINNFDGVQSTDIQSNIRFISSQINQYLEDESAQSLNKEEKHALEQLNLALTIADKLSISKLSSEKINNYLAIINGSE